MSSATRQCFRRPERVPDPPTVSNRDWIELGRIVQPECPSKGLRRLKKERWKALERQWSEGGMFSV